MPAKSPKNRLATLTRVQNGLNHTMQSIPGQDRRKRVDQSSNALPLLIDAPELFHGHFRRPPFQRNCLQAGAVQRFLTVDGHSAILACSLRPLLPLAPAVFLVLAGPLTLSAPFDLANTCRSAAPVWECSTRATCSGVPAATTRPPPSPPSGPRSITQSADFTTSR